jgi:MoxR-like ATPase
MHHGPGNLRRAATSFIGRETDVVEVEAALRAHRLVTLTGVGGVGTTRLATEVAVPLGDEFPEACGFSNWLRSPIRLRAATDTAPTDIDGELRREGRRPLRVPA